MTSKNGKKDTKSPGQPTLYEERYCQEMIDFFSVPHLIEHEEKVIRKDGSIKIRTLYSANVFPTFEKFSVSIGVHRDTLHEWKKNHIEFSDAYKKAKELQKDMLIDLAMRGYYNPTFSIFTAKNITDMTDTVITKQEGNDFDDFNFDQLSKDELKQFRELMAKATPKQDA